MNYAKTITVPAPDKKVIFPPFCPNCLAANPDRTFKASKTWPRWGFDAYGFRRLGTRTASLEIPICSACYKKCHGILGFRAKWPVRLDHIEMGSNMDKIRIEDKNVTLEEIIPIYITLSFVNAEYAQMVEEANRGREYQRALMAFSPPMKKLQIAK